MDGGLRERLGGTEGGTGGVARGLKAARQQGSGRDSELKRGACQVGPWVLVPVFRGIPGWPGPRGHVKGGRWCDRLIGRCRHERGEYSGTDRLSERSVMEELSDGRTRMGSPRKARVETERNAHPSCVHCGESLCRADHQCRQRRRERSQPTRHRLIVLGFTWER